jgi:hypothetical protein
MLGCAHWGVYAAAGAALTASTDLLELVVPAGGMLWLAEFDVWQTTDLGDAAEEVLALEWIVGFTTSGSTGQTANIAAVNSLYDATDSFTAEALNTTQATTGTTRTPWAGGWNIRMPAQRILVPEGALVLRNAERGVLRMPAPADSLTVRCSARCVQG